MAACPVLPSALLLSQELLTGFPATLCLLVVAFGNIFSEARTYTSTQNSNSLSPYTSSDQLQTNAVGATVLGYEYRLCSFAFI